MVKQQLAIARMRSRLGKQIKDFLKASSSFIPALEEADLKAFEEESIDTPVEEAVVPEEPLDAPS